MPAPALPHPYVFADKQLKELKNGRLAMLAVLGELMAQQVSGMGTYEQLQTIINDVPNYIEDPGNALSGFFGAAPGLPF